MYDVIARFVIARFGAEPTSPRALLRGGGVLFNANLQASTAA